MDRRARLSVVAAAAAAWTSACGAPSPVAPAGAQVTVVARGTLGYAVAFAGTRLVSVELGERFELVIRDGARDGGRRVDLGPPERDWVALAARGDRAWVGGDGGEVAAVDVGAAAITARWPVGAPVTALAATDTLVAIGDATGVVCVRRADDGALLQCLAAHAQAIDALAVVDGALVSRGEGEAARAWTLPALAAAPAPAPAAADADAIAPRWRGRAIAIDGRAVDVVDAAGRRRVVAMAGAVRAVAVSPDDRLAVAAWIDALDQPSIVLVGWPR